MAYIPSECTLEEYESVIYSGDAKHRLYVKHGDTIIGTNGDNNASPFASKLTWKRRILKNGSKTFNLNNFVSQEIELVLHNYKIENLKEEVEIKIGTYIDSVGDYVYIPLGIYKIQDNPTNDKNKTTYKLRDKSVDFDFYYDGEPLIRNSDRENENGNKYVTKLEILLDICSKANVEYVGSQTFLGYDDTYGSYDNSITARTYISQLAEQACCFAYMTRDGKLDFKEVTTTSLTERTISPSIIESFTNADNFKISRVLFEAGVNKWENGTEDDDTLFISADNPFIPNPEKINLIADKIKGFEINSFKTGKIYGNPTIDPVDLIKVEYDGIIYKTLAQYNFTFNGVMISNYDTTIEYEAKQSNVKNYGVAEIKKFVKAEINNIDNKFTVEVSNLKGVTSELETQIDATEDRIANAEGKANEAEQNTKELVGRVTKLEQDAEGWIFEFDRFYKDLEDIDDKVTETNETTKKITDYIKFKDGNIILKSTDSENSLVIGKTEIAFMTGENKTAYITNNELHISDSTILNKLTIGKWEKRPDNKGNLNTRWIG